VLEQPVNARFSLSAFAASCHSAWDKLMEGVQVAYNPVQVSRT